MRCGVSGNPDLRYDFERGFRDLGSSAQFTCDCGKIYYNPSGPWDWSEGELESLASSDAIALPHEVEYITFEGRFCVIDCKCWDERGERIAAWLVNHQRQIGEFFKRRKERIQAELSQIPTIET